MNEIEEVDGRKNMREVARKVVKVVGVRKERKRRRGHYRRI